MKTVSVIGLGYIGLPTACLLSNSGFKVNGIDIDETKLKELKSGEVPFHEPHLKKFLTRAVKKKNIEFFSEPKKSDHYLICVPTPFKKHKNEITPDISFVISAIHSIKNYLSHGNQIIIESTCPVGTTKKIKKIIEKHNPEISKNIYISYCPERVLPGKVFKELVENDRTVGGINDASSNAAYKFYTSFVKGKVHKTSAETAEMVKLAENSFRDINIAFANELSYLADKYDINVYELIKLANMHPRVDILNPGAGVGGHCIAVDPWFLAYQNKQSILIRNARLQNDKKPKWVVKKILRVIQKYINDKNKKPSVSCFGISFKPDIDDFRGSPALQIVNELTNKGIKINVVDPFAEAVVKNLKFSSFENAVKNSDILVVLVRHSAFEIKDLKNVAGKKIVLDFVGLFD